MRKTLVLMLMAVLLFSSLGVLTSCNTVEGMGKDIENTGRNIRDAVD